MSSRFAEFKKGIQPRIKELKFTLSKIRSSPLSLIGLALIATFTTIAILALTRTLARPRMFDPFLIPPSATYTREPKPPSLGHPFGTTSWQVDLYYGCIWGTVHAFRLGIIIVTPIVLIGMVIGLIAGYYGGILDEILMRFTDIILSFPSLILIMAMVVAFATIRLPFSLTGASRLDAAVIAIIVVGWPGYTRLIRGEVLKVKSEDYIEAARASGASDIRILIKHILPNSIYPIIVVASLDFGTIVLTTAALSFLGLGVPLGYADWGQLIYQSMDWISFGFKYWWTWVFPGAFITLYVLGWNLLGDAFRDILDPLYRRK
jgi:peptide/nickel transport system permease protein